MSNYGIFINGRRPKTKKEVREACADPGVSVVLENTSLFRNPFAGPLTTAPDGTYHFVGPDPYTSRKFYGTITVAPGKITVK
jgi:hypothetical protein